jgi:DNA-binding CsgD family transcriptional regulator
VRKPLDRASALVEREAELVLMGRSLEDATSGRGGIVVVEGQPGVGKSALLGAVAELAESLGLQACTTSAGQWESATPFGLVRRLFDRPLLALPAAERERMDAGPARLAAGLVSGSSVSGAQQSDVVHSLYWLLDGFASRGPIVLLADDVQWADEDSLLFFASLRERLRELPVLLVVAVREVAYEDRGPALATLLAERDAEVIGLSSLTVDGVSGVIARHWEVPVEPDVAVAAAEVTGGNPFLVEALARLLTGRRADAAEIRAAVPASVVDSVVQRLATLGDDEQRLARAVAVLDAAPTRTAGELAGLAPAASSIAADRLRASGLLADGSPLRFRHALLRSALYRATGTDQVQELHRRAARLLSAEPHTAAAHLLATEGAADSWAVELLTAAARTSLEDGAPNSGVALLRRAVAEPPPAGELPPLLLELGLAELRIADPSCVETLGRAVELTDDPASQARAALALASAFDYAGFHELAADVLDRAFTAVLGTEFELEVEAALVASSLLVPDRIAKARERLAARTGLTGASRGERLFLIQQMANAAGTNQPAAVIRDYAMTALHPDDRPETTDWVWVRLLLSAVGEFDEVGRLADLGLAQAEASGSVIGYVTASFIGGFTANQTGDLLASEEHFRTVLERGAVLDVGMLVELLGCGGLAQSLAQQGRVDEAREVLAGFPEELPADAPVNGVAGLEFGRGITAYRAGDHQAAVAAAYRVRDLLVDLDVDSPTWAAWRALAVESLIALGRLDEARDLALEHLRRCQASEVPHLLGEAERLAALVAPTADAADELLRRSVARLSASGSRIQLAASQLALGSALRRRGLRAEAREALRAAREEALACAAGALLAQAEDELGATGVRLPSRDTSGPGSLTASELRVARMAAEGFSNPEIARALFVVPKTVETHLSRAYRKLGVRGRAELAKALA